MKIIPRAWEDLLSLNHHLTLAVCATMIIRALGDSFQTLPVLTQVDTLAQKIQPEKKQQMLVKFAFLFSLMECL